MTDAKKLAPAFFCLLLCAGALFARGGSDRANADWATVKDGQKVFVSGTLRLVGSGIFNEYVITDARGNDWYVESSARESVRKYEQRTIAVEAVAKREGMTLADGKKLEDRRVLVNVRVIGKD
jgi:hypothetical protein